MAVKTIVVVGTGWAGLTLVRELDDKNFSITIKSPELTSPYTPLLASAACGLFDFSVLEEPVRQESHAFRYVKAVVDDIDFSQKICFCSPAFASLADQEFGVRYDCIAIAPGCTSQTFGTPGVAQNALFVKNVRDAVANRQRTNDILEITSLPDKSLQEQKGLLQTIGTS